MKPQSVLDFEKRGARFLGCSRVEVETLRGEILSLSLTGTFTLAELEEIAAGFRQLVSDEKDMEIERLRKENEDLRLP